MSCEPISRHAVRLMLVCTPAGGAIPHESGVIRLGIESIKDGSI